MSTTDADFRRQVEEDARANGMSPDAARMLAANAIPDESNPLAVAARRKGIDPRTGRPQAKALTGRLTLAQLADVVYGRGAAA